ncbi:carbohydrate ABC transporter permease [Bacillus sp. V3-13]|uniref:carbohydrate ABC transporter permease n=1 Tax=Bacillus sp. V3-13 TaxID=2053728 RepID=UPI000C7790FA|nr:carbohydrate ABC transporter permease [Bacillus sp. V3-13]PLR78829.1 carbohydrate ABC transporter permease [Bacillus sp. V3-13]
MMKQFMNPGGWTNFYNRVSDSWLKVFCVTVLTIFSLILLSIYLGMFLFAFSDIKGGFPAGFTINNWKFLFEPNLVVGTFTFPSVWTIFYNTLVIALGSMLIEVGVSLLSGYALSKGRFPGKDLLMQSTLFTRALPSITTLIASFYMLKTVGLLDTLFGTILIKGLAEVGLSTWIIKGFFDEIPKEIDRAAEIDGTSNFKKFFAIYVPYIWPGIAAITLFAFLNGWGEYILVSTFTYDSSKITFPIILNSLLDMNSTASVNYGFIMTLATFYMVPAMLLYLFSQKYISKMKI